MSAKVKDIAQISICRNENSTDQDNNTKLQDTVDENYCNFNSPDGIAVYNQSTSSKNQCNNKIFNGKYDTCNTYNAYDRNFNSGDKENNSLFNSNYNNIICNNISQYENHDINVMPVSVTQGTPSKEACLTLSQTLNMKEDSLNAAPSRTPRGTDINIHHNRAVNSSDLHSTHMQNMCTLSRSHSVTNLFSVPLPPSETYASSTSTSAPSATSEVEANTSRKTQFEFTFGAGTSQKDTNEGQNSARNIDGIGYLDCINCTNIEGTGNTLSPSMQMDVQMNESYNLHENHSGLQHLQPAPSAESCASPIFQSRSQKLFWHARKEAEEEEEVMYNDNDDDDDDDDNDNLSNRATYGRINLLLDMHNEMHHHENDNHIPSDIQIEQQNFDDFHNHNIEDNYNNYDNYNGDDGCCIDERHPFSTSMTSTLSSYSSIDTTTTTSATNNATTTATTTATTSATTNSFINRVPSVVHQQAHQVRKRRRDAPAFFETEEDQ
jgi:hypothetical protein